MNGGRRENLLEFALVETSLLVAQIAMRRRQRQNTTHEVNLSRREVLILVPRDEKFRFNDTIELQELSQTTDRLMYTLFSFYKHALFLAEAERV